MARFWVTSSAVPNWLGMLGAARWTSQSHSRGTPRRLSGSRRSAVWRMHPGSSSATSLRLRPWTCQPLANSSLDR